MIDEVRMLEVSKCVSGLSGSESESESGCGCDGG